MGHVFGECMRAFELDVCLRVELLGHKIFINSAFVYAAKQFSKVIVPIYCLIPGCFDWYSRGRKEKGWLNKES